MTILDNSTLSHLRSSEYNKELTATVYDGGLIVADLGLLFKYENEHKYKFVLPDYELFYAIVFWDVRPAIDIVMKYRNYLSDIYYDKLNFTLVSITNSIDELSYFNRGVRLNFNISKGDYPVKIPDSSVGIENLISALERRKRSIIIDSYHSLKIVTSYGKGIIGGDMIVLDLEQDDQTTYVLDMFIEEIIRMKLDVNTVNCKNNIDLQHLRKLLVDECYWASDTTKHAIDNCYLRLKSEKPIIKKLEKNANNYDECQKIVYQHDLCEAVAQLPLVMSGLARELIDYINSRGETFKTSSHYISKYYQLECIDAGSSNFVET